MSKLKKLWYYVVNSSIFRSKTKNFTMKLCSSQAVSNRANLNFNPSWNLQWMIAIFPASWPVTWSTGGTCLAKKIGRTALQSLRIIDVTYLMMNHKYIFKVNRCLVSSVNCCKVRSKRWDRQNCLYHLKTITTLSKQSFRQLTKLVKLLNEELRRRPHHDRKPSVCLARLYQREM